MSAYSLTRRLIVIVLSVQLLGALAISALAFVYERHERFHAFEIMLRGRADALLGAAGERDIGYHFPNTDPSLKGIDSQEILRRVQAILIARRFAIVNIDCSLIADAPKIGPYLASMRTRLSSTLQISPQNIGIKATTNEGLGFIGRGEGIAAMAVVSLEQLESRLPAESLGRLA